MKLPCLEDECPLEALQIFSFHSHFGKLQLYMRLTHDSELPYIVEVILTCFSQAHMLKMHSTAAFTQPGHTKTCQISLRLVQ